MFNPKTMVDMRTALKGINLSSGKSIKAMEEFDFQLVAIQLELLADQIILLGKLLEKYEKEING